MIIINNYQLSVFVMEKQNLKNPLIDMLKYSKEVSKLKRHEEENPNHTLLKNNNRFFTNKFRPFLLFMIPGFIEVEI